MFNSTATPPSVRILPNNKVYRQLFDAQVQLGDAYNRVRTHQLSRSVNISTQPDSIPLVRSIRPHAVQKQKWLTSMSYSNDSSTNPITIAFHEERRRRQNERQQELNESIREVFNLPDDIEQIESEKHEDSSDEPKKGNITERLATNRQVKYNKLWAEFLNKISEMNTTLIVQLEKITRQCNKYYEGGNKEIQELVEMLIYKKEISTLTLKSFEHAFNELDKCLQPRLSQIQEYCQSIEELEFERIHKIRDLFQYYSEQLYRTHHLSEKETACALEKQANELNSQIFDNRRVYAELEAKLLTGETVRMHRFQAELVNYQNKWRDVIWLKQKEIWISKLSECKNALESSILSRCEPLGSDIAAKTKTFTEHLNQFNSLIPPKSSRENVQKWYNEGYDMVNKIITKRQQLIDEINDITDNEINTLKTELKSIRQYILQDKVYTEEELKVVVERDIEPLLVERKVYLQEEIVDRTRVSYEQSTSAMYDALDRLLAFIKPAAEQWDEHQSRLEYTTTQLVNMMQEYRRPYDLQNEKKLVKLDSTLDEMRTASNETALSRLLTSSYEQLDIIKAGFSQFYEIEHGIVNKYSDMVTDEVNRYRKDILQYLHARQIEDTQVESLNSSPSRQFYTTSSSGTTYELSGYFSSDPNATPKISSSSEGERPRKSPPIERNFNTPMCLSDKSDQQVQIQTFLTETINTVMETSENKIVNVPFYEAFQIPSNLVNNLTIQLCRAFLDHFDNWREETSQKADVIMFSKHDELDKEMDLQMHLHEPRRVRIETDIHNVRAAEIIMHDERVERHIRGVQETLEQIDADYSRMLKNFAKSLSTYKDDVLGLENVFVNATTSHRLLVLQDRLDKQRDTFMENIRITLRNFRKRFDELMQYLRDSNVKFRRTFKTFSEGGNFSREEIEIYRKKLEKTLFQMEKAETTIVNELEKLEKKELEDATKIVTQFQERFKNHLTDLQFIEITNRWISETQVKIKSEVATNNQNAQILRTLIAAYQVKIDSLLNPNLDKPLSTSQDIRELFNQILLYTYERALYLKCLNNELAIPASIVNVLKEKGLIAEKELVNDLRVTETDEGTSSRRPSRASALGISTTNEEAKSVKFASSSSPTTLTISSRNKTDPSALATLPVAQQEDVLTISVIRSLLHQDELRESDEIAEPGVPAAIELQARIAAADAQTARTVVKKLKDIDKAHSISVVESSIDETTPGSRRERPTRARTRDEIYRLYCTFGEKKHPDKDFLSTILNILRESLEGLLTHSEIYYRDKGNRPVTRPQALREKFDEFAHLMIDKLKDYEEQCRTYHENSITEFRGLLELFERASALMPKIEFDEQMLEAEKIIIEIKQQFDETLDKEFTQSVNGKQASLQRLRPTHGAPARKDELQAIDEREKARQETIQTTINQLRSTTVENTQSKAQEVMRSLATNAERLLILFDEILTADEVTRTKLPPVKKSLTELIKRQQAGKPLEDIEPTSIIERKQGHWPGLPSLDEQTNRRRESVKSKKRSSLSSQRHGITASIVTQKTTLPQIETIKHRDEAYEKYKQVYIQLLAYIEQRYSTIAAEFDRDRSYWSSSIEKLRKLRTN